VLQGKGVHATLLALALGAADVWVASEGFPDEGETSAACTSEAFAAALRAERPGTQVRAWHAGDPLDAPPEGAVRARLAKRGDDVTLVVDGTGKPVARTLPAAEGCERNVATAARIVDGALDELRLSQAAPHVDSLAPPVPWRKQVHVAASAGAGLEQGMFHVVPAFDVAAAVRYRFFELTLDVDVGLASHTSFKVSPPESGSGALGATTVGVEVGAGVAPRLGPGRVLADVAFGVAVTAVTVVSKSSATAVFQEQSATAEEPFGAVRAGYSLDLPLGIFVAARAEGRLTRQASFQVAGDPGQTPQNGGPVVETTQPFSFQALGMVGYNFF